MACPSHSIQFPSSLAVPDLLGRVRRNIGLFGEQFPTVGEGDRYRLGPNDNWLAAFWMGLLWLSYAASGDEIFRRHAEQLLPSFIIRFDRRVHITHDLGFLFTLSARAQWQLTQSDQARQVALRAASELARRYRPAGQYIQAWGPVGDPTEGGRAIIDSMMNIPLLFWVSVQTGAPTCRQVARQHAQTSAHHLVRADGSTYHTFLFDQQTGQPLGPRTHQGYDDHSLWARGQAWAIYGFAVAGAWCPDDCFTDVARCAAERFLREMPPTGDLWWDLRLPEDATRYPDSSAGAIAAAGMLRLARQLDAEAGASLRAAAVELLQRVIDTYLETAPGAQGLLRGGTYHALKGWGVDAYFICGDYFFLEALMMLGDDWPDFWGPLAP